MTEREKTLVEVKNIICSKLREVNAKKDTLEELLKDIQFQIGLELMKSNDPEFGDAHIKEDKND